MNGILELADAYAKAFSNNYVEAIQFRNLLKEEIEAINQQLAKRADEEAAYYDELNRGYAQDRI